jgi:hypothetical protein
MPEHTNATIAHGHGVGRRRTRPRCRKEHSVIVLDIQLKVGPTQQPAFIDMYQQEYVPTLRRQTGYLGSLLLRVFPPDVTAEIGATAPHLDLSMQLRFDTEENRRRWVASDDHERVWPQVLELSQQAEWVGYDVVGRDGV